MIKLIKLMTVFRKENSDTDTTSVCQSVLWWLTIWTYCAAKIFMKTSMRVVYKHLSNECDRQNGPTDRLLAQFDDFDAWLIFGIWRHWVMALNVGEFPENRCNKMQLRVAKCILLSLYASLRLAYNSVQSCPQIRNE